MGETVPEVLSTAEGGTQTEGTVSPNTDRPRPVNKPTPTNLKVLN